MQLDHNQSTDSWHEASSPWSLLPRFPNLNEDYLNSFVSYTRQDPDPPQLFVPHFKQVLSIKAPK